MAGAGFFAEAMGLDDDPGWGKVRFDSLVFGILMSTFSVFHPFTQIPHCLCLTKFNSTSRSYEA